MGKKNRDVVLPSVWNASVYIPAVRKKKLLSIEKISTKKKFWV